MDEVVPRGRPAARRRAEPALALADGHAHGRGRRGIRLAGAAAAAAHLPQGARGGASRRPAATTRRRCARSTRSSKGAAGRWREGLKIEARHFGELAVSDVSRALVSVFFATQEIKKDAGYPEGTDAREVEQARRWSARGLMGAGIAAVGRRGGRACAAQGRDARGAGRAALRHARDGFDERRKRGQPDARSSVQQRMDRLSATTDDTGFRQRDLVIEAVFEDLELKRQVLAEVEAAHGRRVRVRQQHLVAADRRASRATRAGPRACWACTSSRRCTRCRCSRWSSRRRPTPGPPPPRSTFGRRLGKHVIVVRDGPGLLHDARAGALHERGRAAGRGGRGGRGRGPRA